MGSLRTKSGPFFDAGFQLIRFEKSGGKKTSLFFPPKLKGKSGLCHHQSWIAMD